MATAAAETAKQRFERLADRRVSGVEEALRKLGNLANPYNYEFDKSDKDRIFQQLLEAFEQTEIKFEEGLRRAERLRERREGERAPARVFQRQ